MNILHLRNVANVASTLSKAQKASGHNSVTLGIIRKSQEFETDMSLDLEPDYSAAQVFERFGRISSAYFENTGFDIFHLHDGGVFPLDMDIRLWFRRFGKVVVHWHGSKIRNHRMPQFTKGADHTYVSTPDLLEHARGAEWLPNPIDLQALPDSDAKDNDRPRIVHAPTSQAAKGSKEIIRIVDALKKEHDFEFTLIENMQHSRALEIMASSDIIIDQIVPSIGAYGMVSVEGMALGKPVICNIRPGFMDTYYKGCPVQSAGFDELAVTIGHLLEDPGKRKALGQAGKEYVKRVHDVSVVNARVMEKYQRLLDRGA